MRIKIVTNCCYNCKHKGNDFTDGTFFCKFYHDYFDEEIKDCPEFEMSVEDDSEEEY
jgi:hypothetical protein